MKIIGITGPTGAGKTTALSALESLGALRLDADAVYHDLLVSSVELRAALASEFGDACDEAGQVDRKKLGKIAFQDPIALEKLNALTHGFVTREIDARIAAASLAGWKAAAIDAIALVESGLAARCTAVVAVLAPPALRVARIMAREGISAAYAEARVAAQQGDTFFKLHADFILENTGDDTEESFNQKALTLFLSLLADKNEIQF